MGMQFYTIFANAAGGERDPRCLIRVFSIFAYVLERMDFGVVMEDMFELVACYWPIEYQPVRLFYYIAFYNKICV
jgi:DNA repair/transcription protein MET18/MMS19